MYVGRVVHLQVKQRRLIQRHGAQVPTYDPAGVTGVEQLIITDHGMGTMAECGCPLDAYHLARGGLPRGKGAVAFGFTGHYSIIANSFRPIPQAAAGENILIEVDRRVQLADVADGLHICSAGGGVHLVDIRPLPPCRPFVRYLAGGPSTKGEERDGLRVLRGGLRGFAGRSRELGVATISPGHEVWARPVSKFRAFAGPGGLVHRVVRRTGRGARHLAS